MSNRQTRKDGAIIYAIVCGNEILLIRQPNKLYPKWKMPGETMKLGESLAIAVKRGAWEEARLKIPLPRNVGEKVALQNGEMIVGELGRKVFRNYTQYFYVIVLTYPSKLRSLGGKTFIEDKVETIRTKVFNIREVEALPDFLEPQRPFLKILLDCLQHAGKAA